MAAKGSFEVRGAKRVALNTQKLATKYPVYGAIALNEEARDTLDVSIDITPISPNGGTLRRSAFLSDATPMDLAVNVGYTVDYALAVHEIPPPPEKSSPGNRSARHKSPTRYKFLESVVDERADKFRARISGKIGRQVKKFGKALGTI